MDSKTKSKKIEVPASKENWQGIYEFSEKFLSSVGATKKEILDILLSIEEIFVNIYKYAYPDSNGFVSINIDYIEREKKVSVIFEDEGIPFDPTEKKDPNTKLPPEKRKIGGMGIFMVKNLTDFMEYEYRNSKNYLKIEKKLKTGGEP